MLKVVIAGLGRLGKRHAGQQVKADIDSGAIGRPFLVRFGEATRIGLAFTHSLKSPQVEAV